MMPVIILFFQLISYFQLISASAIRSEFRTEASVCQKEECIQAANDLLANMDQSVNPCDDFYQFACGGFMKKNEIPEDRMLVSRFSQVADEINRQIKVLLDRKLTGSEPNFIKMLKTVYDSCLNVDTESTGSSQLQQILKTLGGWPVVQGDQWDSSKFDWLETLIQIRNLGYNQNILVELSVTVDVKNNTANIINLDQTQLAMPDKSYYADNVSDPVAAAYFGLMVDAANKLGANKLTSEVELMKSFELEMTLASNLVPAEERRNVSRLYNKYSIEELQAFAPQVNWLRFFNGLGTPVSAADKILVVEPGYVKKFAELISSTDKRTIANYMLWRVVEQSIPSMSKEWRDLSLDYSKEILGSSEEEARTAVCVDYLQMNLGLALSTYYIRQHFSEESREKALELVKYLRAEFLNMLQNIGWMEESTKLKAIEKANAIISFIGYPKEMSDESLIIKEHEKLSGLNENYLHNSLRLTKWATDKMFSKLNKPVIRPDWRDHSNAAMLNAFYTPTDNTIEFPAAILQKHFFNKDRPYYMNFGAIGYVIGHEITHGFDDEGRQFDKNGVAENWWDDNTDRQFKEKASCVIQQYGNYTTDTGLKLNGVNSQGENIADNGGIKEAYRAYQTWVKQNGPESKLPGLDFTPNQLFWISSANLWCTKYRPETLKLFIVSGVHSPGRFRVLGPFSNSDEFSQDFRCPAGSNMNPHKKCKVW